jgi:hypothetical protein
MVAMGEGRLMDIGAALKGGWVLSTPEHKGEDQGAGIPEEAPVKVEVEVGRSGDQKKGKMPGRGGMIRWAELLARPTNEAFREMVQKFQSTPDVLLIQDTGMTDKACAWADLIGLYVQVRQELRNETVAWATQYQAGPSKARSMEPMVEVAKEDSGRAG